MDIKIKAIVFKKQQKVVIRTFLSLFFLWKKVLLKQNLKVLPHQKQNLNLQKNSLPLLDFILVEKNGFYTITNADLLDSFYSISQNYDKFLEANQIFKVILKFCHKDQTQVCLLMC